MKTQIIFRSIASGFLALILSSFSSVIYADTIQSGYHWGHTTPQFTLRLGDNLTTTDWKSHLLQASSDWNSPGSFGAPSTPVLTSIVAGTSNSVCSISVAGTGQVCNAKYGSTGWLGATILYITHDPRNPSIPYIAQGVAMMNDTYLSTHTYNNTNEREHIMCQQLGRLFGLSSNTTISSSWNSCMDNFSNTGTNAKSTVSTQPNAQDFNVLNAIYSQLDPINTVAPFSYSSTAASTNTSSGTTVDSLTDPNAWGQLMSQSQNGRSSLYKNVMSDGTEKLTYISWTTEAADNCPSCDHRNNQ